MTILALTALIFSIPLSILLAGSPLTLGISIMFLALTGTMLMALLASSWLAMFTFLIYVGGLMVMFAYFTATAPNQIHNIKMTIKTGLLLTLLLLIMISSPLTLNTPQNEILMIMDSMNAPMFLFLVILLLMTLIASVKITQTNRGPLRKFNA